MTREELIGLLNDYGLEQIASCCRDGLAYAAARGLDFTDWECKRGAGVALFCRLEEVEGRRVYAGEQVFCVNAAESERARWEAEARDSDGRTNCVTTVLMMPGGYVPGSPRKRLREVRA